MGEPVDLFAQPVRSERLDGLHNMRVQGAPLILDETAIGHLMGESVFEGVRALGMELRLIQKLGSLEVGETTMQRCLRVPGDSLQQGESDILAEVGVDMTRAGALEPSHTLCTRLRSVINHHKISQMVAALRNSGGGVQIGHSGCSLQSLGSITSSAVSMTSTLAQPR